MRARAHDAAPLLDFLPWTVTAHLPYFLALTVGVIICVTIGVRRR